MGCHEWGDGYQCVREPALLLCRELVKNEVRPLRMTQMLSQRDNEHDSFRRAMYAQVAFEAGLIQEMRKVQVDQKELFLTDLPMHIVLSITHEFATEDSTSESSRVLRHLAGMVESMMAYGLSTRFAIRNILAAIKDGYEVDRGHDDMNTHFLRVQNSRTRFLKEWRRRENVFSRQRAILIRKLFAQISLRSMPSSVLHAIDSFLLGDFAPIFDDEVGIDFAFA